VDEYLAKHSGICKVSTMGMFRSVKGVEAGSRDSGELKDIAAAPRRRWIRKNGIRRKVNLD
jgi:hypothetical protein